MAFLYILSFLLDKIAVLMPEENPRIVCFLTTFNLNIENLNHTQLTVYHIKSHIRHQNTSVGSQNMSAIIASSLFMSVLGLPQSRKGLIVYEEIYSNPIFVQYISHNNKHSLPLYPFQKSLTKLRCLQKLLWKNCPTWKGMIILMVWKCLYIDI